MALAIEGITPRVQEVGRIRMGEKDERGLPRSIQTFRLTSYDPTVLAAAAARYGGIPREWKDAPDPGTYELVTDARALGILIPRNLRAVSQFWELWKGGTCERRCDGRTEELSGKACICGPARGTAEDVCDVVTRVSVILRGIPGFGLWRLDTGGYNAATTLPSTIDFLMSIADPRLMLVPAVLRAVARSSKVRDPRSGKVVTHRFVTPVLDSPDVDLERFVGGPADEPAALPETVERPRPQTAEERVAARAAAVRESHAAGVVPAPAGEPSGDSDPPGGTDEPEGIPARGEDAAAVESSSPAGREQCGSTSDPGMPPVERCRLLAGHEGVHRTQGMSWPR